MSDIVVSDAEFIFAEKTLITYLETLQDVSRLFVTILTATTEHALEDPEISQKLYGLQLEMQALNNNFTTLYNQLNGKGMRFVATIDKKDRFVY